MLTIKGKIILFSTILSGVVLIGFAVLVYDSSKRSEISKLDTRLGSHADKIQTEIEEQDRDQVFPRPADIAAIRTEGLSQVMMQVFDTSGRLIISDITADISSDIVRREAFQKSPAIRSLRTHHRVFRSLWAPVEVDDQFRYVLHLIAPMDEVHDHLENLRLLFLLTIPVALLISGVVVFFITRRALLPVKTMIESARHITATNLEARVQVPTAHDEVKLLAETLNGMLERIEAAFRSQRQFVANASHEIRTPLTIINGELEYAGRSADEQTVRDSIKISLSEIDRLSRMVDSLLMLTKLDASEMLVERQAVRLDEVLVEAIQLIQRLATPKSINIKLRVEQAVEFQGDGEKIKRAILNILDNAVKYSPPGRDVFVELRADISRDKRAIIIIEDNGTGIAESDVPRIFERFFRGENARAEGDGSGLGLAIAKGLIELHGGRINVQSEAGQGTKVTIQLPLA